MIYLMKKDEVQENKRKDTRNWQLSMGRQLRIPRLFTSIAD